MKKHKFESIKNTGLIDLGDAAIDLVFQHIEIADLVSEIVDNWSMSELIEATFASKKKYRHDYIIGDLVDGLMTNHSVAWKVLGMLQTELEENDIPRQGKRTVKGGSKKGFSAKKARKGPVK